MDDISSQRPLGATGEAQPQSEERRLDHSTFVAERIVQCNLPACINVRREEIALLKAFLSAEIDDILFPEGLERRN